MVVKADTGQQVWVSRLPGVAEFRAFALYDDLPNREKTIEVLKYLSAIGRSAAGYFLDQSYLPDKLYATADELDTPMPLDLPPVEIFKVSYNAFMVTERCANILRKFDLGEVNVLRSCDLYAADKTTLLPEKYYFFYFENCKNAFSLEHSLRYDVHYALYDNGKKSWRLKTPPQDNDISVTAAALEGEDLWIDSDIGGPILSIFVSDALAQALKSAGVAKDWMLYRVPVVQAEA